MPKFIENNPFRVLGVFSNATLKEITANKTRIAAYAKVGKPIAFPLDSACNLSAVDRASEAIVVANHELSLPSTKIIHALFWFVKVSNFDEMAIEHLLNGDAVKAKEILSKKESFSSLANLSVLGHCTGDLSLAINSMYLLVSNEGYCKAFVTAICGDTYTIAPFDLWKIYIDKLTSEKKASDLLKAFSTQYTGIERDYLKDKVVEKIVVTINKEIEKSDEILKEQNPTRAYMAGIRLMDISKKGLPIVKRLVGEKDFRYINIADALAKQILQCGINYYNETDDDDDVDKALVLQEYACSIAAGSLIAQRCRQNLEILKRKKQEGDVSTNIEYVIQALKDFQGKRYHTDIEEARSLVENCKPHLDAISRQLGVNNELFLNISTAVANNALGALISIINVVQETCNTSDKKFLAELVHDAVDVMDVIGRLAMSSQERKHFNENYSTLKNIDSELFIYRSHLYGMHYGGRSNTHPQRSTKENKFLSILKNIGLGIGALLLQIILWALPLALIGLIGWICDQF